MGDVTPPLWMMLPWFVALSRFAARQGGSDGSATNTMVSPTRTPGPEITKGVGRLAFIMVGTMDRVGGDGGGGYDGGRAGGGQEGGRGGNGGDGGRYGGGGDGHKETEPETPLEMSVSKVHTVPEATYTFAPWQKLESQRVCVNWQLPGGPREGGLL